MGKGEFCSLNVTMVVWNMDDYPIPGGINNDDLGFIRINIEQVLHRMGFHGPNEIGVYCKRIKCDVQEALRNAAQICHLPSCTKTYMDAVDKEAPPPPPLDMTSFLLQSALSCSGPYGPPDVVVIAKPIGELARVIKCLEARGHNVLLIDPTSYTGSGSFFSVESLLASATLLRGRGRHLSDLPVKQDIEEYLSHCKKEVEEDPSEDPSKIVDFLEPIRPLTEDRTGVFWDGEDFPFPPSPDEMFDRIESVLLERGFTYKLTIWVYLDDDKKGTWRDVFLGDKKWASRIYFLPGGGKASRRIRMSNDMNFWFRDYSPYHRFEDYLILFSDQFKDEAEYTDVLQNIGCPILSVISTQDINKPESHEWPGLLIDGGDWLGDGRH